MADTMSLFQRLQKHRANTRRMLAPGLRDAESRPLAGLGEFGGLKYRPILRAMRMLSPQRLGSLRPGAVNYIGSQISEKFANPAALLRIRAAASQPSIWSEVEQVFPVPATESVPESSLAEPGVMRRGTVIPKMSITPQPGQSIEAFKTQVQSRGLTRPTAPARKPPKPGDPNVRRFSRIEEIRDSRPPESIRGDSAPPAPPAAPPTIQRQPEEAETPRSSVPVPPPAEESAPETLSPPPSVLQRATPPQEQSIPVDGQPSQSAPSAITERPLRALPSRQTAFRPAVPKAAPRPPAAQTGPIQPPALPREGMPAPVSAPRPDAPAPSLAQHPPASPSLSTPAVLPMAPLDSTQSRGSRQPPSRLQVARPAAPSAQAEKPAVRLPLAQPAAPAAVIQRQAGQQSDAGEQIPPAPPALTPPVGSLPSVAFSGASAQSEDRAPQSSPLVMRLAQRRAAPGDVRFVRPERAKSGLVQPARPLITARAGQSLVTRPTAPEALPTTIPSASQPADIAAPLRQPAPGQPFASALSGAAPTLMTPSLRGIHTATAAPVEMPVTRAPRAQPPSSPSASSPVSGAPALPAAPASFVTMPPANSAQVPPVTLPERAPEPARTAAKPPAVAQTAGNVVQRLWEEHQEGTGGLPGGASRGSEAGQEGHSIDLNKLAEDVLPLVKRLIDIESERVRGYSR